MVHKTKLVTREFTYLIKKYFENQKVSSTISSIKKSIHNKKNWNETDNNMIERYFGKIKKKH